MNKKNAILGLTAMIVMAVALAMSAGLMSGSDDSAVETARRLTSQAPGPNSHSGASAAASLPASRSQPSVEGSAGQRLSAEDAPQASAEEAQAAEPEAASGRGTAARRSRPGRTARSEEPEQPQEQAPPKTGGKVRVAGSRASKSGG
jgi:hypothetical protein